MTTDLVRHADTTAPEDRQTIARLLLEQVIVTVEGNTDRVDVELRWAGGFVSRRTLHRWQRVGWITSRKVAAAGGRWAIYADADEMLRLRRLRDAPRGWPQPYQTELITPKPKPNEIAASTLAVLAR